MVRYKLGRIVPLETAIDNRLKAVDGTSVMDKTNVFLELATLHSIIAELEELKPKGKKPLYVESRGVLYNINEMDNYCNLRW